jgi:hypothetical protein
MISPSLELIFCPIARRFFLSEEKVSQEHSIRTPYFAYEKAHELLVNGERMKQPEFHRRYR